MTPIASEPPRAPASTPRAPDAPASGRGADAGEGAHRIRVLFVDDEPHVLEGLRRNLRDLRDVWDVQYANGGSEALELLSRSPCDVIVSDMRMPNIDGASLLETVRAQFPATARIILSGYSAQDATLRTLPVAHQFLAKPCRTEVVKDVVERACALRDLVHQHQLFRALGGIDALPSLPASYRELQALLSQPEPDIARVAEVIGKDMSMSAKLLQLTNSAFFALPRPLTSVSQAVNYLGLTTIRHLATQMAVFRAFEAKAARPGFSLESLQNRSLGVGRTASRVARRTGAANADAAFLAGLLHDVGLLVLATTFPALDERIQSVARDKKLSRRDAEALELGTTHAELGGYLLGLWGLPADVVEAVCFHHEPSRRQHDAPQLTDVLYVAQLGDGSAVELDSIDWEHLKKMGLEQEAKRMLSRG